MALRTSLPVQPHLYLADTLGRPLDGGRVFFGEPNKDPELYPIDIFYDQAMTIPAAQPVRSKGGFMNTNGEMTEVYAAEYTYSVKVLDAYGRQVFYQPKMERINVSEDTEISTSLPYPDVVVRTQKDKNADRVNIKDFGAVVGQNSTAAIQNALNSGARDIEVSDGTYLVTGNLYIRSSKTRFYSSDGSTLDFSGRSSRATCISASGTIGSSYSISADVAAESAVIKLTSNPTDISKGDIITIRSDESDFANHQGFNGEFAEVQSISGLNVTLEHRIRRSYTASKNAKLQKVNMLEDICIDGINIIGTGYQHTANGTSDGDTGISMTYVKNAVVRNCNVRNAIRNAIRINSCYNFTVDSNTIYQQKSETSAQIIYGICWLNYASNGVITNNKIYHGRHGVVQSEDSGYGYSYDVVVSNNTVTGTYAAGLSTHARCSSITWSNNIVSRCASGIDLRSDANTVTGNVFTGGNYSLGGVAVALRGKISDITISGNEFIDWRFASQMYLSDDNRAPSDIRIANNNFKNCTYGLFFEHLGNANAVAPGWNNTVITNLKIINNNFTGGVSQHIKLGGYFKSCEIRGNTHQYIGTSKNYPVALQGAQDVVVSDIVMINSYGILEADISVFNSSGSSVIRPALNNIYRNMTAYQHDPGFNLLKNLASGKNAKILGDNVNNARDIIKITGDSITAECPVIRIDTEGSAATDNLSTINALANDQRVTLRIADTARKITIKHAVGNILTGADIVLGNANDIATLVFNDGMWRLESFKSNA